jgi:hypothetical protein
MNETGPAFTSTAAYVVRYGGRALPPFAFLRSAEKEGVLALWPVDGGGLLRQCGQ